MLNNFDNFYLYCKRDKNREICYVYYSHKNFINREKRERKILKQYII